MQGGGPAEGGPDSTNLLPPPRSIPVIGVIRLPDYEQELQTSRLSDRCIKSGIFFYNFLQCTPTKSQKKKNFK